MCAEANSQHEKSKQNFKVLLLLSFFSTWMKLFHFKLAYLHEFLEYQNIHVIALEKVLLDPIFMILKCDFFYSLWIVFLETSRRFDLSSRSRGHVMFSFAGGRSTMDQKKSERSHTLRKAPPSMNREQGYQLPPIYHQLLLPEQFPRKKTSRDQGF